MEVTLAAVPAAARRIAKLDASRRREVDDTLERLRASPVERPPDKAAIWKRVFPALQNHHHIDLRDGWRLCYSVDTSHKTSWRIIVVFDGTHNEYERVYGFT